MRCTIEKHELKKLVPYFTKLSADKPVLGNAGPWHTDHIALQARADGLWLTGSNVERTLSIRVAGASVEAPGAALCQVALLRDFIKAIKDDKEVLTLEAHEGDDADSLPYLVVSYRQRRYLMRRQADDCTRGGLPRALQAALPSAAPEAERTLECAFTLDGEAFDGWRATVATVGQFVSKDTVQANMTSFYWQIEDGQSELCATNRSTLALHTAAAPVLLDRPWQVLLSPRVLNYLKYLPGDTPVDVQAEKQGDDRYVVFRTPSYYLSCLSDTEAFVRYHAVFPTVNKSATLLSEDLDEVIQRMSVVKKGERTPFVNITLQPEAMVVTDNEADDGYNVETMPAAIEGPTPFETRFDINLLKSVLGHVKGPMHMRFGSNMAPVLIEGEGEALEGFQFLVMPGRPKTVQE